MRGRSEMFEVENARGRPALLAPVSGVLDGSLFVLLLLLEVYCYWCCWLGCLLFFFFFIFYSRYIFATARLCARATIRALSRMIETTSSVSFWKRGACWSVPAWPRWCLMTDSTSFTASGCRPP